MNELEQHVKVVADRLYAAQIACIYKMPEAWQQTPADFMGHTASGAAILIECKQVRGTSLHIGDGGSGLKPHQWSALERASVCGSHSLIVWQNGDVITLMPFYRAQELAGARKSIRWKDACSHFRVTDLFIDLTCHLQPISMRPGSLSRQ